MPRSVVSRPIPRCPGCRMPPRWCICPAFRPIDCPLHIDILMDHVEQWRPSSTGLLINRLIPSSRRHIYRRSDGPECGSVCLPGKQTWILHPRGDVMPEDVSASDIQILLLDGSWRESAAMLRDVAAWGRPVNLPMRGVSRYWLRSQSGDGRFSTLEALGFLLGAFGLREQQASLRLQFELHVYAGLLVRGKNPEAEKYLDDSPIRHELPELVARLARWPAGEAS